jgi:hypothetical protein
MRHLDEGTIHAWLDGALSAEAEQKAEAHAARCTECAVAVADARGLIAASTRILTALDDVPAGVIPVGDRAAPALGRPRQRWVTWSVRVAASILVVGTGTVLVLRRGVDEGRVQVAAKSEAASSSPAAPAANEDAQRQESTATLPAAQAAVPPPPPVPAATSAGAPEPAGREVPQVAVATPQPAGAAARLDARQSANNALRVGGDRDTAATDQLAQQRARDTSPAGAGKAAYAMKAPERSKDKSVMQDSASLNGPRLSSAVESKELKLGVVAAPSGNAGISGGQVARALHAPAIHLVSEETLTEQARVVQRRVYEVSPGVQVTYAIFARRAPSAPAAPQEPALQDAKKQSDEAAGVNTISWADSVGTEFTLSGRLPLDSLRALRPLLPAHPQSQ